VGEAYSSRQSVVLERAANEWRRSRPAADVLRRSGFQIFRQSNLPGDPTGTDRALVADSCSSFPARDCFGGPLPLAWVQCSTRPGRYEEAGGGRATVNERIDRIEARARKATGFGRTRDT
jgi:hypothetical protein